MNDKQLAMQLGYINGIYCVLVAMVETMTAEQRRAFAERLRRASEGCIAMMLAGDDRDDDRICDGFSTVVQTLRLMLPAGVNDPK
jgi:hypothetical protein